MSRRQGRRGGRLFSLLLAGGTTLSLACNLVVDAKDYKVGDDGGGSGNGNGVAAQCGITWKSSGCQSCMDTNCCGLQQTCAADSACNQLVQCIVNCNGDSSCQNGCESSAQSGATMELGNIAACLSGSCNSACNGGSSSSDGGNCQPTSSSAVIEVTNTYTGSCQVAVQVNSGGNPVTVAPQSSVCLDVGAGTQTLSFVVSGQPQPPRCSTNTCYAEMLNGMGTGQSSNVQCTITVSDGQVATASIADNAGATFCGPVLTCASGSSPPPPPPQDSGSSCSPSPPQSCWCADDGGTTSKTACIQTCCQNSFAQGKQDYFQFIANCICADGGGPCASQCASEYCVTPGSVTSNGDPCDQCLGTAMASGGACANPVLTQCQADSACKGYVDCASGCP